jgi:site-specific recombinase XerC
MPFDLLFRDAQSLGSLNTVLQQGITLARARCLSFPWDRSARSRPTPADAARRADRSAHEIVRPDPPRSEPLSPHAGQYVMSFGQTVDYFVETGMSNEPRKVTRDHVEMFVADFGADYMPATDKARYKCRRFFFTFPLEEGEMTRHPMANMKPPSIPETPVPVSYNTQLSPWLRVAEGRGFEASRGLATMLLMIDNGTRPGELVELKISDLDLGHDVCYVVRKGRRPRQRPFGARAQEAVEPYLRLLASRPDAALPWLRLGKTGRLLATDGASIRPRQGADQGLVRARAVPQRVMLVPAEATRRQT